MSTATLDAPAAQPCAAEKPKPNYEQLAEEICNNAVRVQLWEDRAMTTYEFRYDARRADYKESLADKYRREIVDYLPHFSKTHGPIRADNFETMPCFIAQCAACFSYLYALVRRNSKALSFDNKTDKLWAKRMELEEVERRIEELQYELDEAEEQRDELEREIETAEKAERKGAQ